VCAILLACATACGGAGGNGAVQGGGGGKTSGGGAGGGSDPADGGGGGDGEPLAVKPDPDQAPPDDRKDDSPQPAEPEPPKTAELDLVHTVETTQSRDKMSAFLVKPATKAAGVKATRPRAIVLFSALVVARGPGSPEAYELAKLWQLEGQSREAVAVLDRFIAASSDNEAVERARRDRKAWNKEDPFAKALELPSLDAEGKKVFKLGRAAFKKKKYGDALVYFHMGYALAPSLPGYLRELGATYDKLGAKDKKVAFYTAYLHGTPFGKNAEAIRKELKKDTGTLGKLTVQSSLPCELVLLNRQEVPGKLPKKELLVAPGAYTAFCLSYEYELGFWEYAEVKAGEAAELSFQWAIVENKLTEPLGRISIEDARRPGVMMDLGITKPAVGVVVPDDGRSLKVILKDDMGTRSEERYVKLQAGQRTVIKW
jgi:tetratricopeptide (TPR) repeat protein